MFIDSINSQNNDCSLSAFGNVLICSNGISETKTVNFPNGYELDTNLSFKVLFVNGHNCADSSTHMTLTPNLEDVSAIPIVVNKNGTLIPLPIHQMTEDGTTVYKSLQPNIVLEMYYNSNYDGEGNGAFIVIGNPIVLSSDDYAIYADGYYEYKKLYYVWGYVSVKTEIPEEYGGGMYCYCDFHVYPSVSNNPNGDYGYSPTGGLISVCNGYGLFNVMYSEQYYGAKSNRGIATQISFGRYNSLCYVDGDVTSNYTSEQNVLITEMTWHLNNIQIRI